MKPIVVAALYRFTRLDDFVALQHPLLDRMRQLEIRGTLLLAPEGINGTIAGSRESIDALIDHLRSDRRLEELEVKESQCSQWPFKRTRVRLKKEIVTMGVEGIDPCNATGTYVEARDWNDLIADPDVVVIDTRNDYEVSIGQFRGAINPDTQTFRQFPGFADSLDPTRASKVAMYCTGGIRCEKSTALLKTKGFDQVFHLRGGILKYLELVPESESLWEGECFVFDERVSVGHGLVPGNHRMCFACGWPVSEDDQASPDYRPGIHCPQCVNQITPEQRKRFAERQRQIDQAREDAQPAPSEASLSGSRENR